MIGNRLGHYQITGKLGEGGMGVVYRATDSQLGRDVAIKVLPEGVSTDSERLARFEREAKVLASLNHPHVAQIYGIETSGDTLALVMELVEGPTLAERLEQGVPTLDESLLIARQIAEAIEAAHDRGIVHRDLKPQNVKLDADGAVKVLDFGLAKAMDPAATTSGGSASASPTLLTSPTLTAGGTRIGVLLGTAAYMAPEQARGGAVDERADIWAFGVVLWEMLSGRKLFAADSVPDTLAGVLRAEIDLDALPAATPPAVRRLVRRCLARNPKNRLHDIADARIVLDEVLRGESDEAAVPAAATIAPRPRGPVAAALVLAALGGAALFFLVSRWTATPPPAPRVVRFEYMPPSGLAQVGAPKISPDGRNVAFAATDQTGASMVWIRSLDSLEARPLAGTEGVRITTRPFWSPDSRFVAFFTGAALIKVPVAGGPPQKIADRRGADASWSDLGAILFDGSADEPILGVPASGGVPKVVVESGGEADGKYQVAWPQFLPGGKRFLYIVFNGKETENGVWMADADGSRPRRILEGLSRVEFAPPGWLLFVRESSLVAQRFDPESGTISGEPIPVAGGLGISGTGLAEFSASADGVLAFRTTGTGNSQLAFYNLKGARENEPIQELNANHPSFSADGRWLVFDKRDDKDHADIWLRDLKRGVSSRITFDPGDEVGPLFSPDGSRVYFARNAGDKWAIVEHSLASDDERTVDESDTTEAPVAVAPDGRTLVIVRFTNGAGDLWTLDLTKPGEAIQLTSTPKFSEPRAALSPDGRWLAFQSDESGRLEIYVQSFPARGRKSQISTQGAAYPMWSPDGRSILYLDLQQRLNRVPVDAGSTFDAGVPETLFRLPVGSGLSLRKIAIDPTGTRLAVVAPVGEQATSPTTVIVGWNAALPR